MIWAPKGIFAFFLEEGYAKIIMEGDSFHDVHMKMRGKYLSTDFDVVDEGSGLPRKAGPSINIFGMVPLLWPFHKVYTYEQQWVKFNRGVKQERKEVLDHVMTKPYTYGVESFDAETIGKIPFRLKIAIEAAVTNPYKAIFRISKWNDSMTTWVEGAIRDFVSMFTYEEMQSRTKSSVSLSEELRDYVQLKLKDTLKDYGVVITNLTVIDIKCADPEYEEDTKAKTREERKKEAAIVRAEADAEKEAISRMGSALMMVAEEIGQTFETLQEELKANPDALNTKYRKQFKHAMKLVNKNMAIEGKAYFEMKLPKGSGTGGGADYSNMIGAIIAANKITEQQKTSSASKESENNSKKSKNKSAMTEKQKEDLLEGSWADKSIFDYDDED